ncbi:hypothetical protein [Alloactinosynnema sp. L-07]|uniref:hypothetical protein n=1 Tax=Alloactinosynnema sp. L-07 TaxID=1653480 RepID=UPI00065EF0C8|nr:hypothetical protein [Alloactinosynnema sp. L-07]CRK55884.1 hypothetical protein [Alloactinosynnema sp. L-07]
MSLDYTPGRYTALRLAARELIVSDRTVLRRRDHVDLPPEVFAALLVLARDGYLQHQLPKPGSDLAVRPVGLSLPGTRLLLSFNTEHVRRGQQAGDLR